MLYYKCSMIQDFFISLRNRVIGFFYRAILKKIFFLFDPERVHDWMIRAGNFLGRYSFTKKMSSFLFSYHHASLEQNILGIHFRNPIGLSAGFDKNARMIDILDCVGFGFAEIGSITAEPCAGNPGKRLWRLVKSKSLGVYIGLKNDGCDALFHRLSGRKFSILIGISIAKTNCAETVETSAGIADYVQTFSLFREIGDYTTINISCPNVYGGEPFTDPEKLEKLLTEIDRISSKKPVFLKLSPDLSDENLDAILEICGHHRVHGFVCTNLTKRRDFPSILDNDVPPVGGLSGKIVEPLANQMIEKIARKTRGKYVIIGSGGVFSAEDAYRKIRLGASLIQLITGMIYQGPQLISEIQMGLTELLKRDGFSNISQAVGVDVFRSGEKSN